MAAARWGDAPTWQVSHVLWREGATGVGGNRGCYRRVPCNAPKQHSVPPRRGGLDGGCGGATVIDPHQIPTRVCDSHDARLSVCLESQRRAIPQLWLVLLCPQHNTTRLSFSGHGRQFLSGFKQLTREDDATHSSRNKNGTPFLTDLPVFYFRIP